MSALEYVRTRSVLNSRTSCSRCSELARRQLAPIAIRVVCAKSKWGRIFASTRPAILFGLPARMSLSWRIAAITSSEMVLTSASGASSSAGEAGAARASTIAAVLRVLCMEFNSFSIKPLAGSKVAPGLLTTLCQEHAFHVGCGGVFRRWPSHQRIGAPIRAPGSSRIAARYSPPLRKLRMLMADLRSSLGSRELAHHFFRLRLGGRHRVFEGFFAHRHAFDAHDVYVRDADESEDRAKVGLLEIELPRGAFGIDAAAGDHDDGLFALEQAFGAFLAVRKGAPGAHDMVDPRLQAGGQSEVVHGNREHNDIGCCELVHQRVR